VKCAKPYEPSDAVLNLLRIERSALKHTRPRRGVGCTRCADTGYYGRLGVFEVMKVTRPIRELLLEGADDGAMTALARTEGMATLRQSGLKMASRGLTTYEEIARVTPPDA
jgi:type IV pilus assembly protein PilB